MALVERCGEVLHPIQMTSLKSAYQFILSNTHDSIHACSSLSEGEDRSSEVREHLKGWNLGAVFFFGFWCLVHGALI
jgi:hypothetical protein